MSTFPNGSDLFFALHERMRYASDAYGDFASMHEAYGVLAEEFAELLDAVRMRPGESIESNSRAILIRAEALDIAAVALRMAEQAERVTR